MIRTTAGIATQGLDDIAVVMTAIQRSRSCRYRICLSLRSSMLVDKLDVTNKYSQKMYGRRSSRNPISLEKRFKIRPVWDGERRHVHIKTA